MKITRKIKAALEKELVLLGRDAIQRKSEIDIHNNKDFTVSTIGHIYMSLNRFYYLSYNNIHDAFKSWGTSDYRKDRQYQLFNSENNSIGTLGGFYNSFWVNFPIGVPKDFPRLHYFMDNADFNGEKIGVVDRGNTRAIGCWRHGIYIVPTILIVRHFGDNSVVSRELLESPDKWNELSFDGKPSNNEEFFLKHAASFAGLASTRKIVAIDGFFIKENGLFPFDDSIVRDVTTGLFADSDDIYMSNKKYEQLVFDYCNRSNIPMLDNGLTI